MTKSLIKIYFILMLIVWANGIDFKWSFIRNKIGSKKVSKIILKPFALGYINAYFLQRDLDINQEEYKKNEDIEDFLDSTFSENPSNKKTMEYMEKIYNLLFGPDEGFKILARSAVLFTKNDREFNNGKLLFDDEHFNFSNELQSETDIKKCKGLYNYLINFSE